MLINIAASGACTAFDTRYAVMRGCGRSDDEQTENTWSATESPDHPAAAVHMSIPVRDGITAADAAAPEVSSKNEYIAASTVRDGDIRARICDMHPTTQEKNATYAHTLRVDVAAAVTESESAVGCGLRTVCGISVGTTPSFFAARRAGMPDIIPAITPAASTEAYIAAPSCLFCHSAAPVALIMNADEG